MIYIGGEPGLVAPVAIRQVVPDVPASVAGMTRDRGFLEIVIDEQGRVISSGLRTAIHPMYDSLLLNAAKDWKYRPATDEWHAGALQKAHSDHSSAPVDVLP